MAQSNYKKEQIQNIKATPQELDAWEALRREPGLIGRLARRGKHMKRDYVGGRRSFKSDDEWGGGEGGSDDGVAEGTTNAFGNTISSAAQEREHQRVRDQAGQGGGDSGGESATQREARLAREAAAAAEKAEKAAAVKAKKDKLEAEGTERKERRAGLAKEYGGYKEGFKDLQGQADYQDTRDALSGYQGQADTMAGEAGTKFGGYESQISQMADRGGEVAGLGGQVGDLGGQVGTAAGEMGTMAADATDTQKLMEDRGLFAGQIEAKRKAGEKGKMANLRRSMASAGSSPEEIARAEAEASSGGGQAGREDALAASMGAMGAKQSQMAQAAQFRGQQAGMYGQQAGMYGQQAGMLGQAQNLGLQKVGAQAGMYGQGLQARAGLMQMGSSLANQQQMSMQNQIAQQQGLIGSQAGMTDAQMQNVVAQQNSAQELDLAERGLTATANANAANRPKGPSNQEQLMGLVKTGAMVKVAMACIPEGTKIDTPDGEVAIENIKSGTKVKGYYKAETEVLQVHQYKEDPAPHRFYSITFNTGRAVDCCDMHKIYGKQAKDYKVGDKVQNNTVTSITRYNGVERSYDLLTADGGYLIGGIPVNSMIPEMAETIVEFNNKLAA